MFKTRGGGIKGRLNNVKKKLHYWYLMASLMMILNPPSGAKLLTTYEMHYNTIDNNTFQFIKGR